MTCGGKIDVIRKSNVEGEKREMNQMDRRSIDKLKNSKISYPLRDHQSRLLAGGVRSRRGEKGIYSHDFPQYICSRDINFQKSTYEFDSYVYYFMGLLNCCFIPQFTDKCIYFWYCDVIY